MRLGQGLYRSAYRYGQEYAVRHTVRNIGRLDTQDSCFQQLFGSLNLIVHRLRSAVGKQRQCPAQRLERCGKTVRGTEELQDDTAVPEVAAGTVGHRHFQHILISGIEILRLHDRDLDRRRDHHLLMRIGIAHGWVVGIYRHVIGRQLVGSSEGERQVSRRIRAKEGLEGEGALETLAYRHVRSGLSSLLH